MSHVTYARVMSHMNESRRICMSHQLMPGMVRHCRRHAVNGEMDLIHLSKCKHTNCSKIPSFGLQGGQPEFCKKHRCIYIYIYVYTHTHTHTLRDIYICMRMCMFVHIHTILRLSSVKSTGVYICIRASYIYVCTCIAVYTYIYIYI